MDPNLFHLDWDRTFEALAGIVVMAFLVERGLALLFEHQWFVERFKSSGLKEPITFVIASWICWKWDFDAISIVILADHTNFGGILLTGAAIAGGSKASVKLFQDVLGVESEAEKRSKGRAPESSKRSQPDTSKRRDDASKKRANEDGGDE